MPVYCEKCGYSASTVASLTSMHCMRNNGGKHVLYQGGEKSKYICKYCGDNRSSLSSLTSMHCPRHPDGPNKGKHAPAL